MGRDKALLDLRGKPFIWHIAECLRQVFTTVIIASDRKDRYSFLGLPSYEDVFKSCGPLGGIHSGLSNSATEFSFIVSCDLPLIKPAIVCQVVDSPVFDDVTLLSTGDNLQPLCGLYRKRCLPVIKEHLIRKEYSVVRCLEDLHTTLLSPSLLLSGNAFPVLMNINTPGDYREVLKMEKRGSS